MSYQLIFHPQAGKEYMEAYQRYERAQKGLGERFEKMAEQRMRQIVEHPENYSISKAHYREIAIEFFPYTIVYKVNKKQKLIYMK